MNQKRLGLIHTSATLIPVFADLCRASLPNVSTFNIVDDSLVNGIREAGSLTPAISQRVASYVDSAISGGADFVLVTCSSIGPAVEAAAATASVPVLRVDQPMADQAVVAGTRIGVMATLSTTLDPTSDLIQRRAQQANRDVDVQATLVEGAFDALMSGDAAKHDRLLTDTLTSLSKQVDIIVLAQASMARVVKALPEGTLTIPILSSPDTAVAHLKTIL